MKKILLFILLCLVSACSSSSSGPAPAGKQQGDLDATFNSPDGYAVYPGWNKDSYMGAAIQLDGKILVSTGISNGTDTDVGVLRYNPDGTLDTGFANGGVFLYDSGNGNDCGRFLSVDVDGLITLTGYAHNGRDVDVLVMRLKPDGTLDETFGADGVVLYDNAGRDDYGRAIQVRPDGSIFATARSTGDGTSLALVLKFDRTGALDTAFGTDGAAIYSGPKGNDGFRDLAVQPDGKIVAAGYTSTDAGFEVLTARYTADGALDPTFGMGGSVRFDGGNKNAGARGVIIQADGKIVVSGSNSNGKDLDVIVLRYTADGSLDPEFGAEGKVIYDGGAGNDNGRRMAFQQEGKIVVVGNTHNGTDYDALVLRYDAAGVPDEEFGEAGASAYNLGQGNDWGEAVAVQRDQNIVVVGGVGGTDTQALTMRIIGAPQGQFPGSVSGFIVLTDESGARTPLSGIPVRLANMDFEPDLVNYQKNDTAFAASAVTDVNGSYTIGNIGPGNYSVVPMPSNNSDYRFAMDDPSDPPEFSVGDAPRAYQVNFAALPSSPPDGDIDGKFKITFVHKNLLREQTGDYWYIYIERMNFVGFLPYLFPPPEHFVHATAGGRVPINWEPSFSFEYGYTYGVYTQTNWLMLEFGYYFKSGDKPAERVAHFRDFLQYGLGDCPPSSTLEIDWKEKSVKRIE